VLGFRPDDAAEPVTDGIQLHTLTWSISDDEAVLEALEREDLWETSDRFAALAGCRPIQSRF
jgi:hypothetical protein